MGRTSPVKTSSFNSRIFVLLIGLIVFLNQADGYVVSIDGETIGVVEDKTLIEKA